MLEGWVQLSSTLPTLYEGFFKLLILIILILIDFFVLIILLLFFYTHDFYPHTHPRPTTSTHDPRPTTVSHTHEYLMQINKETSYVVGF